MRHHPSCFVLVSGLAAILPNFSAALAQPLTTAFTYQGELSDGGGPAIGTFDVRFRLYDLASGGTQQGSTLCVDNVAVTGGAFTVQLDFGGQFAGSQRFLEIEVRTDTGLSCADASGFTLLSPRQNVTAAPYAMYAINAANAGLLNAQPASFYTNAGNLGSGTLPAARLGPTVFQTNASNTITGTNTFTGPTTFSNAGNVFFGNGANLTGLWRLGGNAGTNPATNFLGTTDSQPLELRVNSQRVARFERVDQLHTNPGLGLGQSVNSLGGSPFNTITAGVTGATIAGGGGVFSGSFGSRPNAVTDLGGVVGGGFGNRAGNGNADLNDADMCTVAGGFINTADGYLATIGGGYGNESSHFYTTVAGGYFNRALGSGSTVGGGGRHTVFGDYGLIAGGGTDPYGTGEITANQVFDDFGIIVGGAKNTVGNNDADTTNNRFGFVGGGLRNAAAGEFSVVVGGGPFAPDIPSNYGNQATAFASAIVGGLSHVANGPTSFIGGGVGNQTYLGAHDSAIAGGYLNFAGGPGAFVGSGDRNWASGDYSAVAGGINNRAWGAYSFIGGGRGDPLYPSINDGNRVFDDYGVIGGGASNVAGLNDSDPLASRYAFVGGGRGHEASGAYSVVSGGGPDSDANTVGNLASADYSTVSGGSGNTAASLFAMVPGGRSNQAGGDYSLAAGRRARARTRAEVGGGDTNGDEGVFIWADSTDADFTSTGPNQFLIRAGGGVAINTNTPAGTLTVAGTGSTSSTVAATNPGTLSGSAAVRGTVTSTSPASFSAGVRGVNNGTGGLGVGVYGSHSGGGYGVYGTAPAAGYAGWFDGRLTVNGAFSATSKAFRIDHPLDPQNKELWHSCVESPDMMNIYNGNATTDAAGFATIALPDYFEALNQDFRYQLTVIDGDPNSWTLAKVTREVSGNTFEVRTSTPNTKVSWQITGVRKDAYAQKFRIVPEVDKAAEKKGTYLNPEAFGQARVVEQQ